MIAGRTTRMKIRTLMPVLGALLLVSGCGSQRATTGGSEASRVDARSLAIYTHIAGTIVQRQAYEKLRYLESEAFLTECLKGRGLTYEASVFTDPYLGWTSMPLPEPAQEAAGTDAPAGWAPGMAVAVAESVAMHDAARRSGRSDPPSSEYDDAYQGCQAQLPGEVTRGLPSLTEPLLTEYYAVVNGALKASGAPGADDERSAYAACVAARGFAADSRSGVLQLVTNRFGPFLATFGTPAERAATGPDWDEALAYERSAAAADAACRADAHASYDQHLEPLIANFEVEHAAEFATLDQAWADLVAHAASAASP